MCVRCSRPHPAEAVRIPARPPIRRRALRRVFSAAFAGRNVKQCGQVTSVARPPRPPPGQEVSGAIGAPSSLSPMHAPHMTQGMHIGASFLSFGRHCNACRARAEMDRSSIMGRSFEVATARRTGKGASLVLSLRQLWRRRRLRKARRGLHATLCHRNSRFGPFRGRFEGMRAIGRSHCAG